MLDCISVMEILFLQNPRLVIDRLLGPQATALCTRDVKGVERRKPSHVGKF